MTQHLFLLGQVRTLAHAAFLTGVERFVVCDEYFSCFMFTGVTFAEEYYYTCYLHNCASYLPRHAPLSRGCWPSGPSGGPPTICQVNNSRHDYVFLLYACFALRHILLPQQRVVKFRLHWMMHQRVSPGLHQRLSPGLHYPPRGCGDRIRMPGVAWRGPLGALLLLVMSGALHLEPNSSVGLCSCGTGCGRVVKAVVLW